MLPTLTHWTMLYQSRRQHPQQPQPPHQHRSPDPSSPSRPRPCLLLHLRSMACFLLMLAWRWLGVTATCFVRCVGYYVRGGALVMQHWSHQSPTLWCVCVCDLHGTPCCADCARLFVLCPPSRWAPPVPSRSRHSFVSTAVPTRVPCWCARTGCATVQRLRHCWTVEATHQC